jgi:SAM-dependent methyltransferase
MSIDRLKAFLINPVLRGVSRSARKRYRLSREYLIGEGIEIGALHNPLPVGSRARVKYVDRLTREGLYEAYPELREHQIVDPDIVDDGERLARIEEGSLDFIIANHFIEHCENPIATLENFFAKLKPGGVVYLAVPDKRFTFDRNRQSTTLDHVQADHLDGGDNSRVAHYLEYAKFSLSNETVGDWALARLAGEMMQERYSIHFHVWTFDEFLAFLHWLQARYLDALEIVAAIPNSQEGIFVLRKASGGSGPSGAGR